jgi:hypothetical protein
MTPKKETFASAAGFTGYNLESPADLRRWIKLANTPLTDAQLCSLQDLYGRSNSKELDAWTLEAAQDDPGPGRNLVFFAINKIMGADAAFHFLDLYIKRRGRAFVDRELEAQADDFNKRCEALDKRHRDQVASAHETTRQAAAIRENRRQIGKRFAKQAEEIKRQARLIESTKKDRDFYRAQCQDMTHQIRNARRVTAALAILKQHLADV